MKIFGKICLPAFIVICNVNAECSNVLSKTTPNSQFDETINNVVIDKVHKLMWARCALGQQFENGSCIGVSSRIRWLDAINQSQKESIAGFSDWRLPNKNELNTIVETACHMPAINSKIFPSTGSSSFWTSSPHFEDDTLIWVVSFANGNVFTMEAHISNAVRLVRDL
jgi:hypothetical protein